MPTTPLSTDPCSPLSASSAYFTTSEGKARFLTRYSQNMTDEDVGSGGDESSENSIVDNVNLKQKKVRKYNVNKLLSYRFTVR